MPRILSKRPGNYLKMKLIGTLGGWSGINSRKSCTYIHGCIDRRLSCERRCIPGKCNPRRCALRSAEGTGSILLGCSASFPTASLSRRLGNVDLRRFPSRMITICLLPLTTGLQTCFFSLINKICHVISCIWYCGYRYKNARERILTCYIMSRRKNYFSLFF